MPDETDAAGVTAYFLTPPLLSGGNGIDTYGEMLTLPSYTFVEEFADWIFEKDPEHPKSTKEIDDMLIDMGYRDLWQEMTSRAKLDLEIKSLGNTLSAEQQQDYKNKLVTSNNRMIGIFEKQISDEAEAKYADFFNKYDFNPDSAKLKTLQRL